MRILELRYRARPARAGSIRTNRPVHHCPSRQSAPITTLDIPLSTKRC